MKYYSTIKKNEIVPLRATWMDLESVILSQVSQTEGEIHDIPFYVESKVMIQINLLAKQIHRLRSQTYGS